MILKQNVGFIPHSAATVTWLHVTVQTQDYPDFERADDSVMHTLTECALQNHRIMLLGEMSVQPCPIVRVVLW
jgi:hypothetical protein